jgi:hypothetical protein
MDRETCLLQVRREMSEKAELGPFECSVVGPTFSLGSSHGHRFKFGKGEQDLTTVFGGFTGIGTVCLDEGFCKFK